MSEGVNVCEGVRVCEGVHVCEGAHVYVRESESGIEMRERNMALEKS